VVIVVNVIKIYKQRRAMGDAKYTGPFFIRQGHKKQACSGCVEVDQTWTKDLEYSGVRKRVRSSELLCNLLCNSGQRHNAPNGFGLSAKNPSHVDSITNFYPDSRFRHRLLLKEPNTQYGAVIDVRNKRPAYINGIPPNCDL